MHEVVPNVVAIAVSIVMAKWMIFCQSSFLFIVFGVMSFEFFLPLLLVIQSVVNASALPLSRGARGV